MGPHSVFQVSGIDVSVNCLSNTLRPKNRHSYMSLTCCVSVILLQKGSLRARQECIKNIFPGNFSWQSSNLIGDLINEQLPPQERGPLSWTYQSNEITKLIILFPMDLHWLPFRVYIFQTFVLTLHVYAPLQNPISCGLLQEMSADHSPHIRPKRSENFSTLYYLLVKCYKPVNQLIYEPC